MHLTYGYKKYKGSCYKSYAIAESYREGKKVRKRIIWPIGKLSEEHAEQIKQICKISKSKEHFLCELNDIVIKESKPYLDIAVVNGLWNQWELDKLFDSRMGAKECVGRGVKNRSFGTN